MSDPIERQALIDAFWKLDVEIRPLAINAIIDMIRTLPSAEMTNRTEESAQNVPNGDLIFRKAAIDAVESAKTARTTDGEIYVAKLNAEMNIQILPSAQPEIIRCGQCKYAEVADPEDSQDGYTCQFHRGSIWFSGSYCSWAERKVDE